MCEKGWRLTDIEHEMIYESILFCSHGLSYLCLDLIFFHMVCGIARHAGTPQQQNIQAAAAAAAAQQQQQGGAGDTTLPSKPTISRQGDTAHGTD